MDVLFNAFKALIDAGSYVMLPIIITVIGLIFLAAIIAYFGYNVASSQERHHHHLRLRWHQPAG